MTEAELSPEDKKLLESSGYGAPLPEEKHNVHSFLHKVATSDDTTKVGNLTDEEIGMPRLNLRTFKAIALDAEKILDNQFISDYYKAQGEIITSTSLSRGGKLINLAVLQKRQIEDVTKPKKENSGWFKKKEPEQQSTETTS